ncbi:MAG TPA: DnaJ domain-containing protein, partial [Candidatus Eisenbacteria bacterium]|nr:DnaJ domain-containing protein [Candidatus Eisenbacteria bacterium]
MERKTYYMVLGVSRTESPTGIRARYRDLAKKLHPDVAGEQATRAFQEVSEAFNVLSDPERRREYNRELSRYDGGDAAAVVHRRRSQPRSIVRDPVSILGNPESVFPSFEALHDRFLRNFTGLRVPKSEQVEGLDFEVLLTPEEAWHGCVVPIGVPVFQRCPQCGGSGRDWASSCAYCRQKGMIETEEIVRIRIPRLVPPGSVFELTLYDLGIDNL